MLRNYNCPYLSTGCLFSNRNGTVIVPPPFYLLFCIFSFLDILEMWALHHYRPVNLRNIVCKGWAMIWWPIAFNLLNVQSWPLNKLHIHKAHIAVIAVPLLYVLTIDYQKKPVYDGTTAFWKFNLLRIVWPSRSNCIFSLGHHLSFEFEELNLVSLQNVFRLKKNTWEYWVTRRIGWLKSSGAEFAPPVSNCWATTWKVSNCEQL